MKRWTVGLAAVVALVCVTFTGTPKEVSAAVMFTENFSGTVLPSSFENSSGVPADFTNADARFPANDTSGFGRSYLRTIEDNYNTVSFVAEVTVSITEGPPIYPNEGYRSAFFGLGVGEPYSGFFYEPLSLPVIYLCMFPDTFHYGDMVQYDDYNTMGPKYYSNGGTGTHRVRLTWDAATQRATFAIHEDYTSGPFVATATLDPIDGSDNGFDSTNSRIFFGGAGDVTFDDFSVSSTSVIPEPVSLVIWFLLAAIGVGWSQRRRLA